MIRQEEPLVGLVALLLTVSALQDVGTLGIQETAHLKPLELVVPSRVGIFFLLTSYIYLYPTSYVSNGLTFVYGFIEMTLNFWIYVAAREERNEISGLHQRYDRGGERRQEQVRL